jgi:hypothetical protein
LLYEFFGGIIFGYKAEGKALHEKRLFLTMLILNIQRRFVLPTLVYDVVSFPECFINKQSIVNFLKDESVFPLFPDYLSENIIKQMKSMNKDYKNNIDIYLFNHLSVWNKCVFIFLKDHVNW